MRGFSLLELLMVLGLISSSLVFVIPQVSDWKESRHLYRFSAAYLAWFANIRSQAIHLNCDFNIRFESKGSTWQFYADVIEPISLQPNNLLNQSFQTSNLRHSCNLEPRNSQQYIFDSQKFPDLNIQPSQNFNYLGVEGDYGRIKGGSVHLIYFYHHTKRLKLSLHNISGRSRVCGLDLHSDYRYARC